MKSIIHRCTNDSDCLNILYDPTYSILDIALFDNINANFYCYGQLGKLDNLISISDINLFPYDFILTNSLHNNYKQLSNILHVPILRYIGFEMGPNFNVEPNTYYISENAKSDFGEQIFQIDDLDLKDYAYDTKKTNDVGVVINYPEIVKNMTDIIDLLNKHVKDIKIINTMEENIKDITKYKCIIDPFPHNQYNMMYCAINNVAYICPIRSNPSIINKDMRTMFVCSDTQQIVESVKKIVESFDSLDFEHDKKLILSKQSNWKSKIPDIVSKVKNKGFIK